jgi:DNA-binding transcriptional regulator LsrR (DeoR family)
MPMRTAIGAIARCDVVQLTGALALPHDESPVELVRDVARRAAGQAYVYYAPMILPDASTAKVLRTQPEVARALARFGDVTTAVVGVGAWQQGLSTVADALSEDERQDMYELGVRSELSGVQLDAEGTPVTTPLSERLIGIDAEQLHRVPEVIGIVYGVPKADAVHAGLRGGFLTSLVTHPTMARALLERV